MSPSATSTETILETVKQTDAEILAKAPPKIYLDKANENPNLAAGIQIYDLSPPIFEDKYEEREFLKQRLSLAFRIFAKYGTFCHSTIVYA